ncbi:hypothetical protein NFI96_032227, partial [Prochilodus magdalenae]
MILEFGYGDIWCPERALVLYKPHLIPSTLTRLPETCRRHPAKREPTTLTCSTSFKDKYCPQRGQRIHMGEKPYGRRLRARK